MVRNLTISSLFVLAFATACDPGGDSSSLRERLGVELADADISLSQAIAAAEAEVPGATVIEADLDMHENGATYDVELWLEGTEHEVRISPTTGEVVRHRTETLDTDKAAEAEGAAQLVIASPGWDAIIAAAEAHVGATVFEVEADADDGVLEAEALSDAGVHELELDTSGNVVKSEMSDDGAWEADEESEDDDDGDGIDDDEAEDEDEDEAEDEAEDENETETEDEDEGPEDDEAETEDDGGEVEDDGGSDDDA